MATLPGPAGLGYFSVALLATAAIAITSGVKFALIGLVSRRQTLYLAYGGQCLTIAALAAGNVVMLQSTTLAGAALGIRWMSFSAAVSFPIIVTFIGAYTGRRAPAYGRWAVLALTAWFVAMNLYKPYGALFGAMRLAAPISLPWGESIPRFQATPSITGWIFHLFTYAIFLWAMARAAGQYRRGQRLPGFLLGVCLLVQFAALLWGDIVVDALRQPYPYLDAFSFLPFVLLMGYALARQLQQRTMELEHATRELRSEASSRARAEENLRHIAYHDALTGLPNRLHAMNRLAELLERDRAEGRCGALMLIDLDNFKTINDSLSHEAGDRLLEAVAERLRNGVPAETVVARLGGDEFAILHGSLVERGQGDPAILAQQLGEAIVQRLSRPITLDNRVLGVGASIGIAGFPDGRADAGDIMRRADIALHRAKAAGRNAVRLFLPQMQAEADDRLELERGLRAAIDRDEFSLHFQPQVGLSGELLGAEVLLRWTHPMLGEVGPHRFIPIAEETGLIHPIGTWVARQACAQIRRWDDAGVDFGGRLAINVSPWQFAHPDFVEVMKVIVDEAGVAPERLTLELTEGVFLHDDEETLFSLQRLSDLGFRLSLDDFGTGYSSLSYLQRLPLDELKIDRAFVHALEKDTGSPLAGFILDIGQRMGLTTVAEGVETAAQMAALRMLGCTVMQGYLFCPPVDASALRRWLGERALARGRG